MQDAQLYLARVLPWDTIEKTGAYINLHWTVPGQNRPFWRGIPCRSPGDVIKQAQWAMRQPTTLDMYVCMSTQKDVKQLVAKSGRTFNVAERSQAGALYLKSLFADIDVKAGAYATTADAGKGIAKFLLDSSIPAPTVMVFSGSGGVHLYWTLERSLTVEEWQPLANALAEALRRHNVHADYACTIDAARVLRLPDTLNRKVNKPVTLGRNRRPDVGVDIMRHALTPYMGAKVFNLRPQIHAGLADDDLAAGIQRTARPINLDSVAAAGCGFIKEAIDTGGAAYSNPLWNLTTLVATFAEGGEEDAHRMARGHAGYTQEDTSALFDRKQRERTEKNLGWPQCATIRASGCTSCNTCPLFQANLSPLNHGKPTPAPPPAREYDLPEGYVRDMSTKVIQKLDITKEGESIVIDICPLPIYDGSLLEEPEVLRFKTDLGLRVGIEVQVPIEKINGKEAFNRVIGSQGLNIKNREIPKVQDFFMAWISKLRTIKGASTKASPFGWSEDKGKTSGFCYAGKIYSPGNISSAATADPLIMQHFRPQGELADWKRAASFITDQRRPDLDVILASAFAAPLVRFTGHRGVYVSAYSVDSGIGKTSALRTAHAVWGSWDGTSMLDDTLNHVSRKMGELRSLPVYWDEIKTEEQAIHIVKLIFQLTGGREKGRLQQDASFRRSGTWQTLLLTCSNDSMARHVEKHSKTSLAGMMRVFEFQVMAKPSTIYTSSQASAILGKVDRCYGLAGEIYAQWLGENHVRVAKEIEAMGEALDKKLSSTQDERLWIATLNTIIMGARYANQLGLTDIDLPAMTKFLFTQLSNMRGGLTTSTADVNNGINLEELLMQFIRDNASSYIMTNTMWTMQGKPPPNAINIMSDVSRINTARIQYAEDLSVLRFSRAFFTEWLDKKRYNSVVIMDRLKTVRGAKEKRARVGAGTIYAMPLAEFVVDVHMKNTHIPEVATVI